jgi:hypothetical protein
MEDYGPLASRGREYGIWPIECSPKFGTSLVMLFWWGQSKSKASS